jgi:tRNA-specific 2-thiouridylase
VPATAVEVGQRSATFVLAEPVRAITPGQSGVLYAGDRVLGGGVIA